MRNAWHIPTGMLVLIVVVGWLHDCVPAVEQVDWPTLRLPVTVVLAADRPILYVGNRNSGSISLVDLRQLTTIGETVVAGQLSDMVAAPGGRLLATDEAGHQLLVIKQEGTEVKVTHRVAVSSFPVSVVVSRDGSWCSVASLWSRRLSLVRLPSGLADPARVFKTIDLPFAPRKQLLVRGDRVLMVADSFAGQLGVVDMAHGNLLSVRELPVHNMRALKPSGNEETLFITHQRLNPSSPTLHSDVHWGRVMSNELSSLRLAAVLDPKMDVYSRGDVRLIGREGRGGGDPAGLDVARDGTLVMALAGVGQIALRKEYGGGFGKIAVGLHPTAVVISANSRRAFVANTFEDSVSVVDLVKGAEIARVTLGPRPELSLAQRGEQLFYDATLSHDGWMSCHSCHTDGHTNGQLNDNATDGSFGAPKRIISLLGARDTAPYAWNASSHDLAAQIRTSIRHTMQADYQMRKKITTKAEALAAYLCSLLPPPSIDRARGEGDETAIARGRQVFAWAECTGCHAPPTYTTPGTYDVGLSDEQGNTQFNPPSLRGVSQRGRYFHDNRAPTLEAVLTGSVHQPPRDLSPAQLRDLLAFLRSL